MGGAGGGYSQQVILVLIVQQIHLLNEFELNITQVNSDLIRTPYTVLITGIVLSTVVFLVSDEVSVKGGLVDPLFCDFVGGGVGELLLEVVWYVCLVGGTTSIS